MVAVSVLDPLWCPYSLEANHLIWVWIMKVKGPKNQADFIEVLYVVSFGRVTHRFSPLIMQKS